MPQTSFAVMTTLGRAKEAAALANATTIEITHIAIGDGATVPSGGETALYNQIALKTISGHGTVVGASNVAYFDCYLAAGEGPYTIREAGLYDIDGDLIAIAHYDPPINKPTPDSGQTVEGTVRLEVAFSDVANVIIKVDPSMQVALQRLTRLPWIPIISMSLATPPALPVAGDTYVIAADPTGAWAGQAGKVAEYTNAGWAIITSPEGHGVSLPDGRVFERIGGSYVEKIALDAQSGKWVYAEAAGTANALTAALVPVPTAYIDGLTVRVKIAATNTGPATLNLNGLGPLPIQTPRGSELAQGDLIAGSIYTLICTGAGFVLSGIAYSEVPIVAATPTLYVRTDGNDGNDGSANDAAHAFATIAAAVAYARLRFYLAGATMTIQLGNAGDYAPPGDVNVGGGEVAILGDIANQANYIISGIGPPGGSSGLVAAVNGKVNLRGMSVNNTGIINSNTIAAGAGVMDLTNVTLGTSNASVPALVAASAGGGVSVNAGCIMGGSAICMWLASGGTITMLADVATANGASWSNSTMRATICGSFQLAGPFSFFGTPATGPRYSAGLNGVISVGGAGANFFPGGTAGSTDTGGQYA
ncbi:Phage-related tail fibre protein-like protein [Nitrobacter hamburgensis X14]|uniref:Phage-related tail fibre protein-like protein n=1 Tax=Nitrobacter hamburgensis (strain DSM 10229 / NCIMB 13809 / X14) TaxID=323097 RepID=Q1QKS6_NITHX|nr:phage tail protein [Nitrobacter hamburgensis]ABE63171.1 Phage-related tail fibre protein-like protein [Nitrobacter hamburgensis X14]